MKRRNILDGGVDPQERERAFTQQVMSLGPPRLETLSLSRQFVFLIGVVCFCFCRFLRAHLHGCYYQKLRDLEQRI